MTTVFIPVRVDAVPAIHVLFARIKRPDHISVPTVHPVSVLAVDAVVFSVRATLELGDSVFIPAVMSTLNSCDEVVILTFEIQCAVIAVGPVTPVTFFSWRQLGTFLGRGTGQVKHPVFVPCVMLAVHTVHPAAIGTFKVEISVILVAPLVAFFKG